MGRRLFLSLLAALCLIATRLVIAQELRGSVEGGNDVKVHGEMSAWRQSHSPLPHQEQQAGRALWERQSRELARPKKKTDAAGFQTFSGLNWKRDQKPRNNREPQQDFNKNLVAPSAASQTMFAKKKGAPASIAKYAPKKEGNKKKKRGGHIKAGFKKFRSEIKNTGNRLKKALAKRNGGKRGKKTARRKRPGGVKPKGTPSTKNTPNILPESTEPQNPLKGQPTLSQSQPAAVPKDAKPKPQVIPALPILQDQPSLDSGELEPVETAPETSSQSQTANAKEPTPAPVMLAEQGAQESDEPPASPSIWSPAASPFSPAFNPSEYEE
jgi:hypothetical protein